MRADHRFRPMSVAVGYEEREIFEAFLRLPVPQRRIVREVIVAFAKAYLGRPEGGGTGA